MKNRMMGILYHSIVLLLVIILQVSNSGRNNCDASSCTGSQDFLPWSNLTQLATMEQKTEFSMKVFVLTMNRPESLMRLLNSISNTFFEYEGDKLELEIHVDKSHGRNCQLLNPPLAIDFQDCCMTSVLR